MARLNPFERLPRSRSVALLICAFVASFAVSCKRKAESKASASASVPRPVKPNDAPLAAARCRELMPGKSFEVTSGASKQGKPEPATEDEETEDSEDDIPLPFAAELGAVQSSDSGFAIGAIRGARGGQTQAVAVLIAPTADSGKVIELGPVHGDPEPPTLAFRGQDLVALVPDNDAGGGMLRVGVVRDAKASAQLTWGDDIVAVRRESGVGGIAFDGERGFAAFVSERKGQAALGIARFDAKTGKRLSEPEIITTGRGEADSARLSPRKGGFWLAFVRTTQETKSQHAVPKDGGSPEETDTMLDVGLRSLELMPLDARGMPTSAPIAINEPKRRELLFDIATLPTGEALIVSRDDSAPGSEGGGLNLIRVRPDGTKENVPVSGEDFKAGAPSLLSDAEPNPNAPSVWVSAAGEKNATWFGALLPKGVEPLASDPVVRGAALLGLHRGRMLIGRSKGNSVELLAIECKPLSQ